MCDTMIDTHKNKNVHIYIAPNILRRLVRDQGRSFDKHWEGRYCKAEPPLLFIFLQNKQQSTWKMLTLLSWSQSKHFTWQILSPRDTSVSPRLIFQTTCNRRLDSLKNKTSFEPVGHERVKDSCVMYTSKVVSMFIFFLQKAPPYPPKACLPPQCQPQKAYFDNDSAVFCRR